MLEPVEIHPGITLEQARWRARSGELLRRLGYRADEAYLSPGTVELLPAVPPAELRVGDVVLLDDETRCLLALSDPWRFQGQLIIDALFFNDLKVWHAGFRPDERPLRVLREAVTV